MIDHREVAYAWTQMTRDGKSVSHYVRLHTGQKIEVTEEVVAFIDVKTRLRNMVENIEWQKEGIR